MTDLRLTVNGKQITAQVKPNAILVDVLRSTLGLTGTHVGCDTAQCGACVVLLDGKSVKACNVLALQAAGRDVVTIEGLSVGRDLHPVQEAFRDSHGLQCGYCTPGMVMSATDLLTNNPNPTETEIRSWLKGNICRCTGYHNIVKAVQQAATALSKTT